MNQLNTLDLAGIVTSIKEVHTYHNKRTGKDEKFYEIMLDIPRLSGAHDVVPVMASEKQIKLCKVELGAKIAIIGSLRTRNSGGRQEHHVHVYAYATDMFPLTDEEFDDIEDKNIVRIEANVCRRSENYRQVGSGRIVADIILANNRMCHRSGKEVRKSCYIPCIAWGNDAKAVIRHINVGDVVSVTGRFQSRTYRRKGDILDEVRVAYELSWKEFDVIQHKETNDNMRKAV